MDDARTSKRLKVPSASSSAAAVTRCDDESFFTDKKQQHQQNQTTDTIDVMRKHEQNHDCDFPQQQHLLLSEYKLNETRTEIVLAETKRDIEMAIERIYREAMKLDHFCDGGGDVFGRNQQSLVGFDMEWKVLYKKGGGEAKTSLLQMAYSTIDVSTKSSKSKTKNVVVLIRLGKRLKYKNPLPSKPVSYTHLTLPTILRV